MLEEKTITEKQFSTWDSPPTGKQGQGGGGDVM